MPKGSERGWDQNIHVHGVPEGPERGWDQQTLGPWCARGTRERVGPANPWSMMCQRDQSEGVTSKPWVHDVPEGSEIGWDQVHDVPE